jgi:hypothetical protein
MDAENTTAGELREEVLDPPAFPVTTSLWTGRLFIIFILLLSIAMGAFAIWFKHHQGRRCLAFWGSHNAGLIRHASTVELLIPGPQASQDELQQAVDFTGSFPEAGSILDISTLPGLVHARHMLIEDQSYHWDQPVGREETGWKFVLRFQEGQDQILLAFDTSRRLVQLVVGGEPVVMGRMLGQLEKYLGIANPLRAAN